MKLVFKMSGISSLFRELSKIAVSIGAIAVFAFFNKIAEMPSGPGPLVIFFLITHLVPLLR